MSDTVLNLTKDLVGIESTNPGKCELDMLDYILKFFNNIDCPNLSLYTEEVLDGRKNFMAVLEGDKNLSELVFICHMDTVVIGQGWNKKPFEGEEIGSRIYGRGACDMKSGMACAMSAFLYASTHFNQTKRTLKFIATVDEEGDMQGVEKVISSGWVNKNSLVLDLEPTGGQIQVAHKGRTWFNIKITGVTAHASRPWNGVDAVAAMAEFIHQLRIDFQKLKEHKEMGKSTITFGMIKGGYQPYVVPDLCELTIDMRLVSPYDTVYAEDMVKNVIKKVENEFVGSKVEYRITGSRPYIEKDDNSELLKYLSEAVKEETNKDVCIGLFPGYTDTAVIAGKLSNINCMSYGPGNLEQAHKPDEYVEKEDILRCEKVLYKLIDRYL